MLLNINISAHG